MWDDVDVSAGKKIGNFCLFFCCQNLAEMWRLSWFISFKLILLSLRFFVPKDCKVGPFASRPVGFQPTRPETDVKAASVVPRPS